MIASGVMHVNIAPKNTALRQPLDGGNLMEVTAQPSYQKPIALRVV